MEIKTISVAERTKRKKGCIQYKVDVFEGKLEFETWVFRSFRGRYGYMVQKSEFTWGKKSTKHGDYGWLDPIPFPFATRNRFVLEDGLPFSDTRLEAYKEGLRKFQKNPDWYADTDADKKEIQRKFKTAITKERKRVGRR